MDTFARAELLDVAINATRNGIVIARADGDHPIVYVNPGFERLTGYSAGEVVGRNCRLLQGPGTDMGAVAQLSEAVAGCRAVTITLRNYRKDGTPFFNEIALSPIADGRGVTHLIGVQTDVTERVQAQERVRFLAYHDTLTGLANRHRVEERLGAAIETAGRNGRQVALLYVDLDNFKSVNDRFGHHGGDDLLRQITQRLSDVVRPGDLLGRQGGDEFLIVLGDLTADAASLGVSTARRVRDALALPFLVAGEDVAVSASVGVSAYPADARDVDGLLRHADAAMYTAKAKGRGSFALYETKRPASADAMPRPDRLDDSRTRAELDRILRENLVTPVYQPIVVLTTGEVVGYEALARGPRGSLLERPDQLFATAARVGRLAELDWACRLAALRGALDSGLRRPLVLFVNVEPSVVDAPPPGAATPVLKAAAERFDIVVELTERALTERPGHVVAAVDDLRERGCAVALDDIGADRRSLALMPFVRPEVIKLDLRLVQENPSPQIASIVHAVNAEAERSGALVLAEGIETEAQREAARALGATHGQGWLFGRPGPLDTLAPTPNRPLVARLPTRATAPHTRHTITSAAHTPYAIISAAHAPRRGTKRLLLSISKHLESQAAAQGEAAVVMACFQDARHFTPNTQARYQRLGQSAAFVGALGAGMAVHPIPGVRGADLRHVEPLRGEWNVVVIHPHFAAAFVGRDLGDTGPDMDRRFDFCLTYDRSLVIRAADALIRRVAPAA